MTGSHHTRWIRRTASAALVLLPLLVTVSARAADKKTERLWKANCASCHGVEGKGDTEKGQKMKLPDFTVADWQKKHTDDEMKKQIVNGVSETKDGVKKEMDPFGPDKLKPEQVDALVAYIRSLAK
jgi:mono/diheme cytochrome c family protein